MRKHTQKQRVRIKAAKIRERTKCARANRPPMLLRSQKLEGNSIRLKGKTVYSFAFDYHGRNSELEFGFLMPTHRDVTDPFRIQEI